MSFDTDCDDYDKVNSFHNALMKNMPERLGTYNEKAADMVVDLARSNLQNNQNINTGELLGSIKVLESNKGVDVLVGSYKPQALYIEYGRGPVRPINAKFLHWIDKETGKDVFSKYAKATEPMPFFQPAVLIIMKKYPQIVVENESAYIKGLTS